MDKRWGGEFFKEELKEKFKKGGEENLTFKRKGGKDFWEVKNEPNEKTISFRIKSSKSYEKDDGWDGWYRVTEEGLEENESDFWVFCFKEKEEKRHCVIVPYEEFKSFMKKHGDFSKQFNFGIKLTEDGKLKTIGSVKEDYSDYLDDKGRDLIKKAFA
ncbi:MAG TPA: hypothetical protein VFF54_08460 [Thermodesulfobacteriota bacterium]|nr:hypothetical protein [Thermodesulfobacteriota bacterium]